MAYSRGNTLYPTGFEQIKYRILKRGEPSVVLQVRPINDPDRTYREDRAPSYLRETYYDQLAALLYRRNRLWLKGETKPPDWLFLKTWELPKTVFDHSSRYPIPEMHYITSSIKEGQWHCYVVYYPTFQRENQWDSFAIGNGWYPTQHLRAAYQFLEVVLPHWNRLATEYNRLRFDQLRRAGDRERERLTPYIPTRLSQDHDEELWRKAEETLGVDYESILNGSMRHTFHIVQDMP